MKVRNLYTCEICYREYESREECERCEKFHKTELEIVDKTFKSYKDAWGDGFPSVIKLKAKDTETIAIYYRTE